MMADESDVGHASSDCTCVPQVKNIHCFIVRRMTTTPQRSEQHVADIHWAPSSDSSVKILKQNLNTTTARTEKKKKLFPLFDWPPPPPLRWGQIRNFVDLEQLRVSGPPAEDLYLEVDPQRFSNLRSGSLLFCPFIYFMSPSELLQEIDDLIPFRGL